MKLFTGLNTIIKNSEMFFTKKSKYLGVSNGMVLDRTFCFLGSKEEILYVSHPVASWDKVNGGSLL